MNFELLSQKYPITAGKFLNFLKDFASRQESTLNVPIDWYISAFHRMSPEMQQGVYLAFLRLNDMCLSVQQKGTVKNYCFACSFSGEEMLKMQFAGVEITSAVSSPDYNSIFMEGVEECFKHLEVRQS